MSLFPNHVEGDFGDQRQFMLREQFMHELNDSSYGYCPFSRVPFDASFNDAPLYVADTFYVLVDDQPRKFAFPKIKAAGEVQLLQFFIARKNVFILRKLFEIFNFTFVSCFCAADNNHFRRKCELFSSLACHVTCTDVNSGTSSTTFPASGSSN